MSLVGLEFLTKLSFFFFFQSKLLLQFLLYKIKIKKIYGLNNRKLVPGFAKFQKKLFKNLKFIKIYYS